MSQDAAIRAALLAGRELSPLDALNELGCFRLAARIDELRKAGLDIETVIERRGRKRYARYRLRGPTQRELFA